MKKKNRISVSQADRKILEAFGERVRKIRTNKKLSVYDLTGDDMPIKDRQHWQRIENGQKNISMTTVFKLARSLEIEPEELFRGLPNT